MKPGDRVLLDGVRAWIVRVDGDLVQLTFRQPAKAPADHARPLTTAEQLEQREDRIEGNHD